MTGAKRPGVLAAATLLGLPMLLAAGTGDRGDAASPLTEGRTTSGTGCMLPPEPATAANIAGSVTTERTRETRPAIDLRGSVETRVATFAMG